MHVYLFIIIIIFVIPVKAQEKPPKPITVTVSTAQHLSFGTFIQAGSSGTVTVSPQQLRSVTGTIILTNSTVTPALFIVTALPGTLITIQLAPSSLHGSNGGTIALALDDSNPKSPFIVPGANTTGGVNTEVDVFIGGTLTVGSLATNPAGAYSGTFQVTFIQQ